MHPVPRGLRGRVKARVGRLCNPERRPKVDRVACRACRLARVLLRRSIIISPGLAITRPVGGLLLGGRAYVDLRSLWVGRIGLPTFPVDDAM